MPDLSKERTVNTDIDSKDCSKSFSVNESINSFESTGILHKTFITPTEAKICVAGSSTIATSSYPSVNDNCNTLLLSYPTAIQNSPEFWDSAIRSTEEVETRIRISRKHTYEDLSVVVRCIDFSPRILVPPPFALIKLPCESNCKENINPQSVGPSKLNQTKHLMLQQSSKSSSQSKFIGSTGSGMFSMLIVAVYRNAMNRYPQCGQTKPHHYVVVELLLVRIQVPVHRVVALGVEVVLDDERSRGQVTVDSLIVQGRVLHSAPVESVG
ncbi:hypothetical protein ZOSMA_146G00370 [Zostera marina]|uniref:Uncharacterized protein n=1 Tax=Zostera marina TaxID=29655 RepID=A0A0K9PX30_ZOSMR|nr:hypothetical protein ZOSMA_146G00370 [Zostera marina]